MLSQLDSEELTYWRAFAEVEPFGPRHEEERAFGVAAAARSAFGGKLNLLDFFPSLKEEDKPRSSLPSREEVGLKLRAVFGAMARRK